MYFVNKSPLEDYFPLQDTVLENNEHERNEAPKEEEDEAKVLEDQGVITPSRQPEIIKQCYEFIPYHPVSVSSEMVGTNIEELLMHNFPTRTSWENSRLANYPEEVILRLNHRSHVKYILIRAKAKRPIPHTDIYIGDGVVGNFNDTSYTKIASANNITEDCRTIKGEGIGNYIRIVMTRGNLRSKDNPFGQVSLSQLKFFGKKVNHMIYYNDNANEESSNEKIDKVLIGLGLPITDTYNLVQDQNYEIAPVDEDTKVTIRDILKIARRAEQNKDYEIMRKIKGDIRLVFYIGNKILNCERQLIIAKSKDDYDTCIRLRQTLDQLIIRRDNIDAIYETSRYEKMILMKRPSTADRLAEEEYKKQLERDAYERERLEKERRERERLEKERKEKEEQDKKNTVFDTYDEPRNINRRERRTNEVVISKKEKIKKEEFLDELQYNQGDKDLEPYFQPRAKAAGGKIPPPDLNKLRRALRQGVLTVMGVRCFSALTGDDWKMREAAVRAFLEYIENPLNPRYIGKTFPLFQTCIEISKLTTDDKVIQIYIEGLKILQTCLAQPICGNDIDPTYIQKSIKSFLPIYIKKISEFNDKQRDLTLKTIIDIFRHPALNVGELVTACLDIVENNDGVTPDKQPWNILFARLEIILRILDEYGIDETLWDWYNVFVELIIPSLFHQNQYCRLVAEETCVILYKFVGSDIRNIINGLSNLKPNLKEKLNTKMNEVDISIKKESDTANRIRSGTNQVNQKQKLEPIIEAETDNV